MSTPLEEYALLSDLGTAPLVSRDGSIDWLCVPRYDSPAIFSALLGGPEHGRWRLSVVDGEVVERRYIPHTFVLETTWRTPTGRARVTDFLPLTTARADVVRRVQCLEGTVEVEHDLRLRFDYARATPWVRVVDHADGLALLSVAGPYGLVLTGPLLGWADALAGAYGPSGDGDEPARAEEEGTRARRLGGRFVLDTRQTMDWVLTAYPSFEDPPAPIDVEHTLAESIRFWTTWSAERLVRPPYERQVLRSMLVLRALTYARTGGVVAAPTTSLPEDPGGSRNWDYRYVWLRDAALTIEVAVAHGRAHATTPWRSWLLRAVAGDTHDIRIMYGLAGERELTEKVLDHLPGYEGSRPVRIGNGAARQYQADVAGEVMIALALLRDAGVEEDTYSWGLQKSLLRFCERNLDRKDHGIWEMRGERHHFTHGRVMMWAAFDCGIRAIEHGHPGLDGPVDRWRELRDGLRAEIDERGFDRGLNSFVQAYDLRRVDASLLQLPHTGFVAYDDPRMLGTVERIESELRDDHGLILRYRTDTGTDGLQGHEHPFLICNFWLVEQYALSGRLDDARALMAQLVGYANDVGLLAEEYDPAEGRLIGNYPQAFSHIGLIRAADAIAAAEARTGGRPGG